MRIIIIIIPSLLSVFTKNEAPGASRQAVACCRPPASLGRGRSPQTVQRLWSAVQYSPSLNNHRLLVTARL